MGYIMDLRKDLKNHNRVLIMCSSGVIIINCYGKILLQQRTDNLKWGLPGGSIELGESFEEAAKREVFEEVNLKVNTLKLFNIYSGKECHHIYPNGDEIYNASAVFITNDYSGDLKADIKETKSAVFFDKNNFPHTNNINPPDRIIIKDIIENLDINKYIK